MSSAGHFIINRKVCVMKCKWQVKYKPLYMPLQTVVISVTVQVGHFIVKQNVVCFSSSNGLSSVVSWQTFWKLFGVLFIYQTPLFVNVKRKVSFKQEDFFNTADLKCRKNLNLFHCMLQKLINFTYSNFFLSIATAKGFSQNDINFQENSVNLNYNLSARNEENQSLFNSIENGASTYTRV